MDSKEINRILKEEIKIINLDKNILEDIEKITKDFISDLKKRLKNKKISADVFVGGSLAKKTLVKKEKNYDIDIFVRFDKKYGNEKISSLLGGVLGKNAKKIHGSRDYYEEKVNGCVIEIIPVLKIKNPKEAQNVTDLSYFHVNYVLNKIKKEKNISDEIKLAKTFAYSQDCYGAESYIKGFSGYAIELLICHYGSFLKFISEISNSNLKIFVDDSKFYKNKLEILRELNESKIQSPIILIDPTYKERNALAGLSEETYLKFKKSCKEFLSKPSLEFFKRKNLSEELIKKYKNLKIIEVKTDKQKGDIAGTKLKKFFNYFLYELKKEFEIKIAEFFYDDEKNISRYFFLLDKKKDEIKKGPPVTSIENLKGFKKAHADAFIKDDFAYARMTHNLTFEEFLKKFLVREKKTIDDMSVKGVRIAKK